MRLQRAILISTLVPICILLEGCSGSDTVTPGGATVGGANSGGSPSGVGGTNAGGASSIGGGANGGSVTGGSGHGGANPSGGNGASGGAVTGGSGTGGANLGGASSKGGAANGGNATGGNANGGNANGGNANGGAMTVGGTTPGGKAAGGSATGGSSLGSAGKSDGGAGVGGVSAGGASAGGTSPAAGTAGVTFVEDDGTDCTVGTLPEASALTAITKLPDPFKRLDGTRISAKADWRCRRQEIKKLVEKFAMGTKAKPQTVTGTVTNTNITVNVSDSGKTATFSATVSLPSTGTAPYPAVIVYGGMGADSTTIQGQGVALINYDPYSTGKEGTGRASKAGAYYNIAGATSTTGLLVAWAWGVSRIIDVIAASDGKILKADAIGVTGCSRFGKGSFLAGVFDQRVALTMPVESGTAGVPIWRNVNAEGGQTLSSAYGEQPWFGDAFSAFTSAPTKAPVDTHELIAMIAPRGLFIMDNPHITNLGPKSAHAAALAGAEVYKALGAGSNITYWSNVADGNHCAIRPEWKTPMQQNIKKFLLKTGNDPGSINAHTKATATAADWIDWTTPTLQ